MNENNYDEYESNRNTPPPINRVRNPFDKALIGKLHMPICSPGMCKMYKRQVNGSFRWEIDQACALVPEDIVACSSQFEPTPDPVLERIAEEATEKYFSEEFVIPSPLESSKKIMSKQISSIHVDENVNRDFITREVSCQTILTLPPVLPPEVENILQKYYTFTQDQDISGEYEISANGSLKRKLFFEEHSDAENYDSEQTDDECQNDKRPSSNLEHHTPVRFSPDLSRDLVTQEMKRTFGTPLSKTSTQGNKPGYRNKFLHSVDMSEPFFSPVLSTPQRVNQNSCTPPSITSVSISPVAKMHSSDEEKNNFSSPECDPIATCLDCVSNKANIESNIDCFCTATPNKSILRRSASLKETEKFNGKSADSLSGKRCSSMSNLQRNRSVQKLNFNMDMSIDDSVNDDYFHRSRSVLGGSDFRSTPENVHPYWSMEDEASILKYDKTEHDNERFIFIENQLNHTTPVKSKTKVDTHLINTICAPLTDSPLHMSLDQTTDSNTEHVLSLEDKKIDFNNMDLKFLSTDASNFDFTVDATKADDGATCNKKLDSGFNENTFYTNTSSYYESAIKPSELTVTDVSRCNPIKGTLKEITNMNWGRIDSGFREESSTDSDNFYLTKKFSPNNYLDSTKMGDKENMNNEDFDKFNKNEVMSISDIFSDEITFNCNFSSTPSKKKGHNFHS